MLTITLPVFEGPLDLLLYLVEKQELDIHGVDVAAVAQQYLAHLRAMEELDLELASEFFVMAVRLLGFKARALLPPPVAAAAEGASEAPEDPRTVLIRELMDYRICRDRARALEALAAEQGKRYARAPAGSQGDLWGPEDDALSPSLLVEAYRLTRARTARRLQVIPAEVLTVRRRMVELLFRLRAKGMEVLAAVCGAGASKREFVMTLLALLELLRRRWVTVVQPAPFAEIRVAVMRAGRRPAPGGRETVN